MQPRHTAGGNCGGRGADAAVGAETVAGREANAPLGQGVIRGIRAQVAEHGADFAQELP